MRMESGADAVELPLVAFCQCVGVNRETASATEPAAAFDDGRRLRAAHAGCGYFRTLAAFATIGCMLDLTHARIEAGDHSGCTGFLWQSDQCAGRNDRQAGAESEPLGNTACNSESGKRSRPGAESDAIELLQFEHRGGQQILDHGKNQLGMPLDGMRLAMREFLAVQERGRAVLCRGIEGEKVQSGSAAAGSHTSGNHVKLRAATDFSRTRATPVS